MLWIGQCIGQALFFPDSFNGAVGGSVEFALDSPPPPNSVDVEWNYGFPIILTFKDGVLSIQPAYRDRATLDTTTLALRLMNLRFNDTGTYKLSVTNKEGIYNGLTSLVVYENVSDTKLTGLIEPLIETKSIAKIKCDGNGNITSMKWMKDNNPLNPSDRVIFSSDNKSVSIGPVIRSDSGEYQCTLANPVSSETAKLNVIINYGPDNVLIDGLREVGLGQKVSLSCSATSVPSASFTWKFNGTVTGVNTETFTIEKTDITHSGEYLCTAWNNVTNQTNDSQSHSLVVKEGGDGGGGLTTGAIVGIVIGVLVAVGCICGLIVYLTKTKKIC
ncbi:carcinoembryonic antigen-related cell adhesion molecule 20-like [Triplophysa dalaica]|uniref:carcinoembryonic antigen-related cell adhesion molecule 20-like n=1 Tax=Triplophysa dalaica TaxID=1582913 RepID=UPI0024DF5A36|nr:carcinoembryonic antigen-related cell adhesion molecule 20-like [Triplophysa dalaica]